LELQGISILRKNFVLIDFESVQPETIEELSQDHFSVLMFVGANQAKISFDLAAAIQKMGNRAEYIKMSGNGPNALDFHIAFYIGKISAQDPAAYFHIISRDKGFDPLIQHLKTQKIFAARSEAISEIPIVKNYLIRSPQERAQLFVERIKDPKLTKPRTTKTLSSSIKAHFQQSITDEDIPLIIDAMQESGFISVDEGKIIYTQIHG
jgi:hypothetical protein